MDPYLVFLLEPPGNSEFRSAASQINDVYVTTNQMREPVQSVKCHWHWQVSEAGVHRPHVGGIHGRSNDGSYSLVLAGGFEDEVVGYLDVCSSLFCGEHVRTARIDLLQDRGDEFTYTGSGGRDLSGNKRIGEHSFDQTLTHMNRFDRPCHAEAAF